MPEGGWALPPKQDVEQSPDSPQRVQNPVPGRPHYRSGIPTCKICDSGTLRLKEVHRLSGPAVAIGFILLIPSVLGMLSCAAMLLVFNTSVGATLGINANVSRHLHQNAFDADFRRSCAESTRLRSQDEGRFPSQQQIEEYCECALSSYKESGSVMETSESCTRRVNEGTLDTPSRDVDALYSGAASNAKQDATLAAVSVLGNAFFIGWGVAFFVSGLLGWLLVMKKRVLQCDVCGAVVNAS
jgi:hypothetical protein